MTTSSPPEQVCRLLNRLDEPKRVEEADQLDCVDITKVIEMNVEISGDNDWTTVEDEELQHGREFIVEHRGDRSSTVDGQDDDVGRRELHHGQDKLERTRHEIDRDPLVADVVAVEENDTDSQRLTGSNGQSEDS